MTNMDLYESGHTRGTGKRRRAKLIASDVWGSSAFYPAEVLERDAAEVFVPGTKMYENHLTESEEWERPEGDVSRLVGKLTSYGMYEADNPEGPGVYADVEFYDSYVDRINEIGTDIGLSIAGNGDYVEGEMAGRFGKIITRLQTIRSVDVVTAAGAGGKLVSILESARPMAGEPIETEGDQSVTALTKEEFELGIAQLKEALSAGIDNLGTSLKEALVPAPVVDPAVEGEPVAHAAVEPVTIDHAAVITAITEAELPTAVVASVVADVTAGATIEAAISKQTGLKEAFAAAEAPKQVRIVEAEKPAVSTRDQVLSIFSAK